MMHKAGVETNQGTAQPYGVERAPAARDSHRVPDTIDPGPGGLRAARIASVMAEIRDGFADQQFSTSVVARRLGLSIRYVQDLLQGSGSSITDRIMAYRLAKAHQMLIDDRSCALKVSDIAAVCGFNELSYFHRAFRRRFGASPAKYRARLLRS